MDRPGGNAASDPAAGWIAARATAARLTPAGRQTLGLLAAFPLATTSVVSRLAGHATRQGAAKSLAGLAAAGLVTTVTRHHQGHGRPRHLWMPTDLGVAALACLHDAGASALARAFGLGGRAIAARLADLDAQSALHACVAWAVEWLASRSGYGAGVADRSRLGEGSGAADRVQLLGWRRGYRSPVLAAAGAGRRWPAWLAVATGFAGDGAPPSVQEVLLLPDIGTITTLPGRWIAPLTSWHGAQARQEPVPQILIVTDRERLPDWRAAIAEASGTIPAESATIGALTLGWWDSTTAGERAVCTAVESPRPVGRQWSGCDVAALFRPLKDENGAAASGDRRRGSPPATLRQRVPADDLRLARTRRDLSPAAGEALALLARQPFLTPREIAAVRAWTLSRVRAVRRELLRAGLARVVGRGEIPAAEWAGAGLAGQGGRCPSILELTSLGLAIAARHAGYGSVLAAERDGSFVGGGPAEPVGERARLTATFAHTRGTQAFVVALCRAGRATGLGWLHEWRNATAAAGRFARPDAAGLFMTAAGRVEGPGHLPARAFWLEFDRDRMFGAAIERKILAYADEIANHPTVVIPAILFVTTASGAVARVAACVRALGASDPDVARLPVFVTTTDAVAAEPGGPLGPIWHRPGRGAGRPVTWLGDD